MNQSGITLEELERDALTELLNIAVSRAASSLRKMVGSLVGLTVPAIEIMTRHAAARLIEVENGKALTGVGQRFSGEFSGRAMLIVNQQSARRLSRMVMDGAGLTEQDDALVKDALAETGNVMLNACVGSIANMLNRPLHISLPEIILGEASALFELSSAESESIVLFTYINFHIGTDAIRGYVALLVDLPSLQSLKLLLSEFIARAIEETS